VDPIRLISENQELKKKRINTPPFSNRVVFIAGCTILAFLIRFFLIPTGSVINGDGIYYASLGKKIMLGDLYGGISAYWSPLYSLLIGISALFFQDLEFSGRFVSVVCGALLVIPAYYLINDFYGRVPARLGTILVVIHPFLIKSSIWVMTESLYALIFTTSVIVGWRALRSGRARTFFFTGLLFGAAYLTKPESIGFVGLFFVLTLGTKFFRRSLPLRRLAAGNILLLFGFTIFFLPYVIFLHQKTGYWTISQKLLSNISAVNSDKGLLELTDDGQTTMRDRLFNDLYETENRFAENSSSAASAPAAETRHAKLDFKGLLTKTLNNLKKQVGKHIPAILPLPLILVAVMGFFLGLRTRRRRAAKDIYLFSFVVCVIVGYALTVIELRYLFSIIPILLGWAAYEFFGFGERATEAAANILKTNRKINPLWFQVFILLVMAASLTPLFLSQFKPEELKNVPFEEKQAGLWIKNQRKSPILIMASSATSAFYAEANHIFVPDEEFTEVLEYAKRKRVDYIVFSQRRLKNTPRAFPVQEQDYPEELNLVYKDDQNPDYKILVFRLLY
jgi:4-amino-4-deoxy-L-arabinose transferase-like glycosyltransferase